MHASTLDTPLFRSINTDCSPPSDGYSDRAGTLGRDIFGDAKASVSAPDSTHSRSFDAQSLTPDYTQSLAPQFMLGSECDVWFGEPVIPTSPCLSSRLDTALDATVKEVEEAELSTLLGSRAPSLHVHGIPSLPAGIAPWTSFRTTNIDAISVLDRVLTTLAIDHTTPARHTVTLSLPNQPTRPYYAYALFRIHIHML
jgi:hypothetical protein